MTPPPPPPTLSLCFSLLISLNQTYTERSIGYSCEATILKSLSCKCIRNDGFQANLIFSDNCLIKKKTYNIFANFVKRNIIYKS